MKQESCWAATQEFYRNRCCANETIINGWSLITLDSLVGAFHVFVCVCVFKLKVRRHLLWFLYQSILPHSHRQTNIFELKLFPFVLWPVRFKFRSSWMILSVCLSLSRSINVFPFGSNVFVLTLFCFVLFNTLFYGLHLNTWAKIQNIA